MPDAYRVPYRTGVGMSAPINLDALIRPTYRERPARPDAELRRAVDEADPAGISSAAAVLLDHIAEQVTRSPVFRKLVAPQGDAPGGSVSTAEASRFGEAVLSLLDRTSCAGCGEWWSAPAGGASRWTCRCRSLVVVTRPNTR